MMWNITRPDPIWVRTPKDISNLKERFQNIRTAAIDTETTGLDTTRADILFWSISFGDDRWFLEREHLYDCEEVFRDRNRTWIGTHTKFDAHMMANCGVPLRGELYCTLVMDRLLNPDFDHGLKEVYEREFDEKMATFSETFYPLNKRGKPQKPKNKPLQDIMMEAWGQAPERVVDYASLDAWGSYRVFRRLRSYLKDLATWQDESLWELYRRFEAPFTKVLYTMERVGMQIDVPYLESLRPKIEMEQAKVSKKLARAAGQRINMNSPKQLRELFFGKLKLKIIKRTPTGEPSTDEKTLSKYAAAGCKEAEMVLRYRKLSKILGTYVNGIIARVDRTGRIHGTYNQHVTDTARLSSSDPNLQNIPRPDHDEFKIRQAFIARPDHTYGSVDYDQVELFLTAHFSKDKNMIEAIHKGLDLHAANAAMIWKEPYKEIVAAKKKDPDKVELTPRDWWLREIRQFEKIVVFGLIYGKAGNALARDLKILEKVKEEHPDWREAKVRSVAKRRAQGVINQFFEGIPGVRNWINATHRSVAKTKFVETLSGRRRWLQQVMSWEDKVSHLADAREDALTMKRDPKDALCWCDICRESRGGERRAVNTIIQGSAADLIQGAMLRIYNDPDLSNVIMTLQVHDELGCEVPLEIEDEAMARIKHHMINPGFEDILRVPLKCDPNTGDNWVQAK
jgi:DNA polymerase-1